MGKIATLFIVVPLVELWLLLRLGDWLGPGLTIALVVVTGLLGAALAKQQGLRVWRRWQQALAQGLLPEEGVLGSVLVLVGGVLLVTPGVLTDVLGLSLLVPVTRGWIASGIRGWLARRGSVRSVRFSSYGRGFDSPAGPSPSRVDVIDVEGEELP